MGRQGFGCGNALRGMERRPREKEALPSRVPAGIAPRKFLLRESLVLALCGPGISEGRLKGLGLAGGKLEWER